MSSIKKLKKVKVSKNRKKSWRKHTDISEFEDFLNDKRFEERIGHSIGGADDDELFVIEKTGDDTVYQKKLEQLQTKSSQTSINESKLRKLSSGHRLFQKLESTSKVPAVRILRSNSDKRKTLYNDDEKLKKFWNDRKDSFEKAKQQKESKKKVKQDTKLLFGNNYDLWDDNNENEIRTQNKVVKKVPVHLRQKPSLLPAVEVPLPGQSYNPSEEDYKSLIMSEAEKELQKIKEENILKEKVDKYFLTKDEAQKNEKEWLTEMSQGLFDNDAASDIENGQEQEPETIVLKTTKKKTKSQKRRELKEKLAKKKKQEEKSIRIKENDVFRIKTIEREIKEQEQQIKKRALARQAKHIESLYKPKRLSRHRFEEAEAEFNLPTEITGSLRSMKIAGNILQDRFKSFQKRNIIETRVVHFNKRKYKLRSEMKRRHREETK